MAGLVFYNMGAYRKLDGNAIAVCTCVGRVMDNLYGLPNYVYDWRKSDRATPFISNRQRCLDVYIPRLGYSDSMGYVNV